MKDHEAVLGSAKRRKIHGPTQGKCGSLIFKDNREQNIEVRRSLILQ
jgi:hypothetical protein